MTKEEQQLMELLNALQSATQSQEPSSGEADMQKCSEQSVAEVIATQMLSEYSPYLEVVRVIPLLMPSVQEALDNVASIKPVYEQFRNFVRNESIDSVLTPFKEAMDATGGNIHASLDLTKLIIEVNKRMAEVVKESVEAYKKGDGKKQS